MSTHDYNLANQSGASFRSDLNNALAAILSNNSNASDPTTTVAFMIFADTNANKLKIRNSANDAFIDLINLDGTIARDLTLTGASANIVFDQSDNALEFADNAKATFGTGADLTISHNASNSIINDSGVGELLLQRAGDTILTLNSSGIKVTDPNGAATVSIQGFEGGNANLSLKADEGDDDGDTWLLSSTASDNSFHIYNDVSGGNVSKFQILTGGHIGVGLTPQTSDVATNVSAGLIQTDANIDIRYAGTNTDPAGARYLNFINTDTSLVSNQPMGGIHWIGNDSDAANNINCAITALNSGSGGASAHILFKTSNGTERMRISHDGNVRIGNSGSIGQGTNGTIIPPDGILKHARPVNAGSGVIQFFGNLGRFQILGDGDAQNTNNTYQGISDQEIKENIVDANSQWNDIKALKVRNYNFKESTKYSTHKQIGVIAQELEASGMNGLVKTNDDELYVEGDEIPEGKNIGDVKEKGYKSVKYSVLYMKSVKALQEAMAKIETLETKVAALEAG